MIDAVHPEASIFLLTTGSPFLVVFALPLLFAPIAWARRFLWRIPSDTQLVGYLGRCLGAVAAAVCFACLRAAPEPAENVLLFELVLVAGVLLTAVHVWGAVRREQPWTETAEIALYAAVTGVGGWILARL